MMTLAHRAGNAPEMTKVMVMVKGIPTWWPLPKTWNKVKNMPNSERWKSAIQEFVDKTSGVDGLLASSQCLKRRLKGGRKRA